VSIIEFSTSAKIICPLKRVTEQNKPIINNCINQIKIEGGTQITAGMKLALEMLKSRKVKNPINSIFLLSDGLDEQAKT